MLADNLLYRACRNNTQLLLDKVSAWRDGGAASADVQEAADALTLVLAWPAQVRQLADTLWRQAVAGKADALQQTGESFLKLVDDQIAVVEALQHVADTHARQGDRLRRSIELGAVLGELKRIRAAFADGWPWINEETLAQSRQEYDRGDFQTAAEILDELQGKNP